MFSKVLFFRLNYPHSESWQQGEQRVCSGVQFTHEDRDYRIYFPNPSAVLPVRMRSGEIKLLPWGRRKPQAGKLPMGGWARQDSIYAGKWDRFFPIPVKLPLSGYMEKNFQGESKWYELDRVSFIQGLVANMHYEQRVYIVTIEPDALDCDHDRLPLIKRAGPMTVY